MDSFDSYVIRKLYKETAKHGDKLAKIEKLVNWKAFRPIIQPMYTNQSPSGGRPNTDPVLMVKLLVLQAWYGLNDPELERQAGNRIDFMHFLGFPEKAPDYSTVWMFRERLAETGRDKLVWEELQRQLDAKGLTVRKGVVQDASFITSDPGHARADKPRGEEAKTRRSRDGAWVKKGAKSVFGYRLHMKMDLYHGLIRELETTPANVHDSRIDLSRQSEVVYRDRGYPGTVPRGWDATMKRASRGHPLSARARIKNTTDVKIYVNASGIPNIVKDGEEINFAALSGGEKTALLIITRTILLKLIADKIEYMMLDEPLEHLDSINRRSVLNFLMESKKEGLINQLIITTTEKQLLNRYIVDPQVQVIIL